MAIQSAVQPQSITFYFQAVRNPVSSPTSDLRFIFSDGTEPSWRSILRYQIYFQAARNPDGSSTPVPIFLFPGDTHSQLVVQLHFLNFYFQVVRNPCGLCRLYSTARRATPWNHLRSVSSRSHLPVSRCRLYRLSRYMKSPLVLLRGLNWRFNPQFITVAPGSDVQIGQVEPTKKAKEKSHNSFHITSHIPFNLHCTVPFHTSSALHNALSYIICTTQRPFIHHLRCTPRSQTPVSILTSTGIRIRRW